jgi:hypothetical protein
MAYQEGNQCWRIRNTFLEFYDGQDDDLGEFSAPTRQRSASAGPMTTPTSRVTQASDLEQVVEARSPCQDHYGMEKTGFMQPMEKSGMQVVQQEGYVAKRGGGLREPYHAPDLYHAPEEVRREIKSRGDDAVVLSLASLTTPPSESVVTSSPSDRMLCVDEVTKSKQGDIAIAQATADGIENPTEKDADVTTAMIRHIACRYTQDDIASFLNEAGFAGKYNWVYLPLNPQKTANLGYVFVNFVSPETLDECRDLLDNQVFGPSQTTKRCQVTMALLQGPRIQRRSRRKVKDKHQQAELAMASGEADRQSCPRSSLESCNSPTAAIDTSDAHLVLGA